MEQERREEMDVRGMLTAVVAASASAPTELLHEQIRQNPAIRYIFIAESVEETEEILRTRGADLLFVDLDLPGGGGFWLAERLHPSTKPSLIFTSTDDSRAVDAFRYQPIDYILYGSDPDRVSKALLRASERALASRLERGDRSLTDMLQRARKGVQTVLRLMVKTAGRISFVKTDDIDWVEAERDYVRIHNAGRKHLLRQRISHLEQQLPRERFLRIHRSTIVNIDRIKELQPLSFGEYSVILYDGTRLTMSRSFRDRVFERLQSAA
jgi:two-component system, LytTR family, response regulator